MLLFGKHVLKALSSAFSKSIVIVVRRTISVLFSSIFFIIILITQTHAFLTLLRSKQYIIDKTFWEQL